MPESAVSSYQKDPTVTFPDQSRGVRPVRSVCSCCSESLGLLHLYSASTVHKRTAFTSSHVKEISPSFINKKVCSTPSLPLSPSTLSSHHELAFQSNTWSEGWMDYPGETVYLSFTSTSSAKYLRFLLFSTQLVSRNKNNFAVHYQVSKVGQLRLLCSLYVKKNHIIIPPRIIQPCRFMNI